MNIFKFLFSEVDESTNDKLGAYPEKVHVNAMPERRYLKTSRSMTILASTLLCGCIVLAFVIYMLAPQLRSEPLLLAIDRRFYRLEPVQRSIVWVSANQLLMEEHIKQYILLRHTIVPDVDEMRDRWGDTSLLRWFSDANTWKAFKPEQEVNMARMMEGLTAEVNVRFVSQVTSGLWLAEFDTFEHMPEDELPTVKRWRALLEAGFSAVSYAPNRDERIKNALNFQVRKYSLGSRALTADNKNAKFED